MCVIMMVDFAGPEDQTGKRPTQVMVEKAFIQNPDGAGIAWRYIDEETGKARVAWKKGITDPAEVWKMVQDLPLPFIVHFRRASSGGKMLYLNHPFPISPEVEVNLEGTTNGWVQFHNGDWKEWQRWMLEAAIKKGERIPSVGKMNDSRAMAWLAHLYGIGFMELLEKQKGVAFGPETYRSFAGGDEGGWAKVDNIWCSNDKFCSVRLERSVGVRHALPAASEVKVDTTRYCRFGECESQNLDQEGYCPLHTGGTEKTPLVLMPSENGGAQLKVSPFCGAPGSTTPPMMKVKRAFQLTQVKDQWGNRLVSMNCYKKLRNLYGEMAQADLGTELGHKQFKKAKRDIQAITQQLIQKGIVVT